MRNYNKRAIIANSAMPSILQRPDDIFQFIYAAPFLSMVFYGGT